MSSSGPGSQSSCPQSEWCKWMAVRPHEAQIPALTAIMLLQRAADPQDAISVKQLAAVSAIALSVISLMHCNNKPRWCGESRVPRRARCRTRLSRHYEIQLAEQQRLCIALVCRSPRLEAVKAAQPVTRLMAHLVSKHSLTRIKGSA